MGVLFKSHVLYLCIAIIASTKSLEDDYYRPRITEPRNEIETITESKGTLVLTCEGRRPITWTYPNNTLHDTFWDVVDVSTKELPNKEYPYQAKLTLTNASYVTTGFFYCHETTTINVSTDKKTTAKIYVYVRDPEHLSVYNSIAPIVVHQYTSDVIPCKPTSPDVMVTLERIGDPTPSSFNKRFDPKIGFTVQPRDINDSDEYLCEFTRNDIVSEIMVNFHVLPRTESVEQPVIHDANNGHTVVGQKLNLTCEVPVQAGVKFDMLWQIPCPDGIKENRIRASKASLTDMVYGISELIITKTVKEDQGEYTCIVIDHSNNTNEVQKYIVVYEADESFIRFNETNNDFNLTANAGDQISWSIFVDAHPQANFTWYKVNDKVREELFTNNKYKINTTASHDNAFLLINNVGIADSGLYILNAKNHMNESELQLSLSVSVKPTVELQSNKYHMLNSASSMNCSVAGYPFPSIEWSIKKCQLCEEIKIPSNKTTVEKKGMLTISRINVTQNDIGIIKCVAFNSLGMDEASIVYNLTDVEDGFNIWGLDTRSPVARGDSISLHCGASVYTYTDGIEWFSDPNFSIVTNDDNYAVTSSHTKYSYRKNMIISSIMQTTRFSCRINEISDDMATFHYKNITVQVADAKKPTIVKTNLKNKTMDLKLPDGVHMMCLADGIPKPNITWYKDDKLINFAIGDKTKYLANDNQVLIFEHTVIEDEGEYSCKASNRMGIASETIYMQFKNKAGVNFAYVVIIVFLFILSLVVISILCIKVKKEKKLTRELKIAGLANFEKGNIECLNPELGVDDQAELLPYDKKWEFPRDKLHLGKQLGSGAFGVVMKAKATGLNEEEQSTVVAVKMVKGTADPTGIKALASELKIMVHLGKHINVVNLLGACTKNVTKRELLVIVEYCRYGNLQNYLLRHRSSFINQIDRETGNIDPTIGSDALERTFSINSNASSNGGGGPSNIPHNMVDYRVNYNENVNTGNTEMTSVCMTPTSEEYPILSNNSVQPDWRSNYRGDYKDNVRPISTTDLVTWGFQVARGMDYLASRKVLHGDLAARNILLSENNVVKICDFGLAKSMYKNDNYKKKSSGLLPVKWMAVESISDRVFSTQSDVWSFGIVLWEFFSTGCNPYPGMEANELLYNKLVEGYRMEQPEYATNEIYQIMLDTWHKKPSQRPSFARLEERLGMILEEGVRKHYISLNDPYLVMNTQRLENHSDYLAMLSPPDYGNLASPNDYVNHGPKPDVPEDSSGYLCMKPTRAPDIFSPRVIDDENIFSFDVQKKRKSCDEDATGIELMPMLHRANDSSDGEQSASSPKETTKPETTNAVSNPNYYKPPVVASDDSSILKSADNYVNMPKNKSLMKGLPQEKFVQYPNDEEPPPEKHYVNGDVRVWDVPTYC